MEWLFRTPRIRPIALSVRKARTRYAIPTCPKRQRLLAVETYSLPAVLQIGAPETTTVDNSSDAPKLGGAATLLGARSALSTRSAAPFFGTQIFNTSGATREQDEPNHAEVLGGASHWLTYQAPETGILRLTTEGSEFDTVMAIYSGSGTEFASLKVEASDNNSGPDGQDSVATVKVRKNSIYFIAIDE